jgi:hypothetical protein
MVGQTLWCDLGGLRSRPGTDCYADALCRISGGSGAPACDRPQPVTANDRTASWSWSSMRGRRLMRGMRRAIRALAEEGNDLIVDDVLMGEAHADCEAVLQGFTVHWVGVMAPLEVLEERERARRPADRHLDLAYDRRACGAAARPRGRHEPHDGDGIRRSHQAAI